MLVPYGKGKLKNTKTGEVVDDPVYRSVVSNEVNSGVTKDGVDLKEKFGIYTKRYLSTDFILSYIVGNELVDTYTKESFNNFDKTVKQYLSQLSSGVRPDYSVLLSCGPNVRIDDLVYVLMSTAYRSGLNVSKYKYLAEIKLYKTDDMEAINSDDLYIIAIPTDPSVEQFSDLCTILDMRARRDLPTVLVAQKGNNKAYRTIYNLTSEYRYDLVSLVRLEQERSIDTNKILAEGLDYDFTKADQAAQLKKRFKGDLKQGKAEEHYEQVIKNDFVNIIETKAVTQQQMMMKLYANQTKGTNSTSES